VGCEDREKIVTILITVWKTKFEGNKNAHKIIMIGLLQGISQFQDVKLKKKYSESFLKCTF